MGRRVMLVGLDCVPPALAFERYAPLMPNLTRLRAQGTFARLRSTTPPITVPAWTAMISGRDPGELGLYGFRKRVPASYALSLADSRDVQVERVWDLLARRGLRSSVIAVPPSSPPFPVHGELVSCFLTADADTPHTYPAPLAGTLRARFGPYIPDVEVRAAQREGLEQALVAMTRQHFAIARQLWTEREPDFLMLVEIGPDRLHHAFYADMDPSHPLHDPGSKYVGVGERYYALLDRELGSMMALADDDTAILVASDHGARPLRGAFRINEWLQREGFLTLHHQERGPLKAEHVDWSRTQAWAEGGYYARVFCNLRGREPQGIVEDRDAFVSDLASRLRAVRGPAGERWHNHVHTPQELYRAVRGFAPDLIAIFADLDVRPIATVGTGALYAERDDRDADACNHDMYGIFACAGAGVTARGHLDDCQIQDVGATVLALLSVPQPEDWLGRSRA
ncbi:MAG TPA: alkaline phosphatase family protein [Polyangiales bacterium]|nr:alkaline phosphatase family protein [Polyangiales bacterium]